MSAEDHVSTTDAVAGGEHQDDPQALREQIEQTRAELGDTVQALSDKTDVKGRANEKIEDTKEQVREKVQDTRQHVHETVDSSRTQVRENQVPIAVIAGGALALVLLAVVWSRRS